MLTPSGGFVSVYHLIVDKYSYTGGFYQDEMGETECKYCGTGTYVSEERHPGKSATDCWACPYGRYCAISYPELCSYPLLRDKHS